MSNMDKNIKPYADNDDILQRIVHAEGCGVMARTCSPDINNIDPKVIWSR